MSNFEISHLETLLASAKVKPVANQVDIFLWLEVRRPLTFAATQILFHPYVYARQAPLVEWMAKNGIVTEAYSILM